MTRIVVAGEAPDWAHQLETQLNRAFATRTLPSYSVTQLPKASPNAQMIFVLDESGGPVPAFSSGGQWLRCTDRAIVS